MKKYTSKYAYRLCLFIMVVSLLSCKKQNDWLDAKRFIGDVTPQTIEDYQAIFDYSDVINTDFANIGLIGTDNLFIKDANFNSAQQAERDAYLWKATIWDGQNGVSGEWDRLFKNIGYANIVLDGLKKIDAKAVGYNNVKGQAFFFRAFGYYNLAQLFCKQYDPQTASTDLGLPLRQSSDVNIIYPRATLQQTYDQMLADIKQAISLLDKEPAQMRRAGRFAALALLAKVELIMGNYKDAGIAADQVLQTKKSLLDYNSDPVSQGTTYRFPALGLGNPEILFYASVNAWATIRPATNNRSFVFPELIAAYESNDLRKALLYVPNGADYKFRGCYTGGFETFCGIALNEVYLIRAECYARQNNVDAAMDDINTLLSKRYVTGTFSNLTATNAEEALRTVLRERRKELPFSANIRWEDLRRLNKDPRFQVTITRTVNGEQYVLPPNSTAYVLPIPRREIELSKLVQNER
ncbi:RagB/SusD family nutrient uptake outer membrane protein [Pedobacter sp. B4-66]|uniref:RagB/SusD family nutrient uptake outer membrane protein n=1 Tax=Pedobacter sp. B4-66 TaxID=2817280 RepID=UPI001BDAA0CC|nr:RagB/SusD family nutrient uptake outer membrane protein [Pedobacter sp. B4-66]